MITIVLTTILGRASLGNSTQSNSTVKLGWLVVFILAGAAAVAQAFGRFAYGLLLPAVRDDLGITNTFAGFIGGANVGAYLLGTILVAWATSHFRLLNVLRTGLVLATAGLMLAALSSSPYMLMVALFIAGIGGACVWIPAPIIAADALPLSKRGLAVGLLSSGIGLGVSFVSLLGGSLRSEYGDQAWTSVYQVLGSIGFVVIVALLIFVRHIQSKPTGGAGLGGFGALTRMIGWKPFIFSYSIFGFMYFLVIGFLTTRLEDDSGWSSSEASFAFTLMGIAMIFGGPIVVEASTRLGTRITAVLSFLLWPVFVLIVLTGISWPTLMACFGLGLLFSGIPTLMTLYVVENTTAQDYGPSFAAGTLAFGIAQMISPPIGGLIADLSGSFLWVFVLSSLMGAAGLIVSFKFPRHLS